MSQLDKVKSERARIRRSFTKISKKIEELFSQGTPTDQQMNEVISLMELLNVRNAELGEKNEIILSLLLMDDSNEEEVNSEQDKIDEYELNFLKQKTAVAKIKTAHDVNVSHDQRSVSEFSETTKRKCKYKMPILQLKKFGGDLGDWLPFWSQFSKFDKDEEIDDVDKLGYLTQCMVENSPAKLLVDSYPATGELYSCVVKALKDRFGRNDLLTEYYVRELLTLIIQNTVSPKKLSVSLLYDKLQCHLRNLELLGVTPDNHAPMLMPLVSSSLPTDLLKVWERTWMPELKRVNPEAKSKDKLANLILFLQAEVEGDQKIELATSSFGFTEPHKNAQDRMGSRRREHRPPNNSIPTAAGLLTAMKSSSNPGCIFCNSNHSSQDCKIAQNMTLGKRREKVSREKACFCCLRRFHVADKCRNRPKCVICQRGHFPIMCDRVPSLGKTDTDTPSLMKPVISNVAKDETLAAVGNRCGVLMQTLVVTVRGAEGQTRTARLLIDSASHRSYVLAATARDMGYTPRRQEAIQHSLFGGATTGVVNHNVFQLYLSKLDQTYHCNFEVLEQERICGEISPVFDGPWIQELDNYEIELSDTGLTADIEILVGADVASRLWTGRRIPLSSGLVAMETSLGWTLSGKVPMEKDKGQCHETLAMMVTNLSVIEANISDLWTLDTLGITDPSGKSSRAEIEKAAQQHFLETVSVTEDRRFEVHLPWIDNHPPLPDNYRPALKRLHSTVRRLKAEGHYDAYQGLLNEWLKDNVIEEVPLNELDVPSHYLPHRHVVKLNSTTPVRPVFDASSRENRNPSLNMCLEKGPNLIEKIPSVLARFRLKKVAVVGDIKRAFLQIGLSPKDRNFLRFLWIDKNGVLRTYRHRRVVFGVSPSPFLLESCIKFHLDSTLSEVSFYDWPVSFIELLANSFYVDNCLASLDNEDQARQFMDVATRVMAQRQFELRGWEFSGEASALTPTNVLGLYWHKEKDVLSVNLDSLLSMDVQKINKKVMLSAAHRIFDPIGMFCGVSLIPKLLIQRTWELGLTWEQEVDDEIRKKFLDWFNDMPLLREVEIPRWVSVDNHPDDHWTLHVFTDACQTSYAAIIFLRVEHGQEVSVRLVAAKARVAPTSKMNKGLTIPRLELLAASIGARLYAIVMKDYNLLNVKTIFWTDATTVLAWINRNEPWDVFVMNRIKEIRKLTEGCEWRHVPGSQNPADLPSRGCSPRKFLSSHWWEGPKWLKEPEQSWPQSSGEFDEEEIVLERKRIIVSSMANTTVTKEWYYRRFSHYKMIVRLIGWLYRFKNNLKLKKEQRLHQDLTTEEYAIAEYKVLSLIQEENLQGVFDSRLSSLQPFVDANGLIRIMTKISYKIDSNDFRHPIILSTEHPVVERLILDLHITNCHAGTHIMISILRQQFWILGGRRAIRGVLNTCIRCKRYSAKRMESKPIPLPEPRVRSAKIFEICGVDLAGPLYLKAENGATRKGYICLFTCAVYRAVHLELISSQSTDSFILGFRRFMSRRGRPTTMYSDQGSNFLGLEGALRSLNWTEISQYSSARKIDWRFNPPSAPWWGGWWERLIGVVKTLLRRVLGRASLDYEEMLTILCDCEAVVNSRPITYLSNDPDDPTPLTPSMFLQDVEEVGVPDLDLVEAKDLRKRQEHRRKLTQTLKERFRDEYLGQLKLSSTKQKIREVTPGEIVLVGDDKTSRLDWPLGRVIDVVSGADGICRVVRVKTASGELLRPIQRLYPLELHLPLESCPPTDHLRKILRKDVDPEEESSFKEDNNDVPVSEEDEPPQLERISRRGRKIQRPQRLDL